MVSKSKKSWKALMATFSFVASLALVATLTGASAPPSPSLSESAEETIGCWQEFETGNRACAPTEDELKKVILEKYNKVLVESPEEFEAIKKSKTFRSMSVPDGVLASYHIGTLFNDANYSGSFDSYSTTNSSTCYGQIYTFSWPSVVYNDQTSSFYGAGACQVLLYENINYGGGFYGYYDCRSNLANVGFNDRASSVRFHLTSTYSCF